METTSKESSSNGAPAPLPLAAGWLPYVLSGYTLTFLGGYIAGRSYEPASALIAVLIFGLGLQVANFGWSRKGAANKEDMTTCKP